MAFEVTTPDKLVGQRHGGDDSIPRTKDGRPRIWVKCWSGCDGSGKVPSQKVEGRLNQCPGCKGAGRRLKVYTRTTTFIDCIEDKSNLMTWGKRMVLAGVSLDRTLLDGVAEAYDALRAAVEDGDTDEVKKHRDWLNRRAEAAADKAGANDKAAKGTELHDYSEAIDKGLALPESASFDDIMHALAWSEETSLFDHAIIEKLVVLDEFEVAGTPDRMMVYTGDIPLVAPDGSVIGKDELICGDLKTGTTEYGQLKMAMQLAIYVHSEAYDPETGERSPQGNVNTKWGIIINIKPDAKQPQLLWADLTLGWEAVHIARDIRSLRSRGARRSGGALTAFSLPMCKVVDREKGTE